MSLFSPELLAVGLLIGTLSGMLGVGGGVVLIPALNLLGIPMHTVVGISISYVGFTSASGVVRHFRQGTIDPILALPIMAGAAVTVQEAAYFCNLLSGSALQLLFGLLLILVAASFSVVRNQAPPEREKRPYQDGKDKFYIIRREGRGEKEFYKVNVIVGVLIGVIVGFLSGMFGIGGGFLTTPLMVMAMHIPITITMGTSLLSLLLASILGSIAHWKFGNVDFHILMPLTLGGILGSQIGAILMLRLSQQKLRAIFNAMLIAMSFYMFTKGMR